MNLNQQFINADIVILRERLNKAILRQKTAQDTINHLNIRIKAKQALISK